MANVDIKLGYKDSAWFTANASTILLAGQIVYLEQTGTYKLGDGTTQLSALTFLGGSGTVDVNTIGAAINGATSATPNDTDLVMSVESSVAKKNTWTQIKAFLKTYFDTVYATITDLTGYVKKGTLTINTIPKATASDTIGNSNLSDDGTTVTINSDTKITGSVKDSSSVNSANFYNRATFASDGTQSILWDSRQLQDSSNNPSISWIGRALYRTDSTISISYNANKLNDSTGTEILDWSTGLKCNQLTASQIVETDASKNLISAAKGTAYNKNFGTTTGTIREGDNRTFTDLTINGSGGAGYLNLTNQSSAPSTPSSGTQNIYTNSIGKLTRQFNNTQISTHRGIIYSDVATSSALTGGTANTLMKSGLIKGNTFSTSATDTVRLEAIYLKTGVNAACQCRYYTNTSNSLSGASLIGFFQTGATVTWSAFVRNGIIKTTTNTEFLDTATSSVSDMPISVVGASGGKSSINIDWTVDQYLIAAAQNLSASDSTVVSMLKIYRD